MERQYKIWLIILILFFFTFIPFAQANPKILYLPFADPGVFLKEGWIYSSNTPHNGIDYFKGQSQNWKSFEVRVAADGIAEYREGGSQTWGNYVFIKHNTSPVYYSLYAHLFVSPLAKNTPTVVKAGDLIGIAGSSGKTEPPGTTHLHFEWSKDNIGPGYKLDPYGISNVYTYYPTYPNFVGCGTDINKIYWWTVCPPVTSPGLFTKVSGSIAQNTTWKSGNVYLIENSAIVEQGIKLTIESGVIVKFKTTSGYLENRGLIEAKGTTQDKIYFTSYHDDSVGGDTNGNGSATSPVPEDFRQIIIKAGAVANFNNVIIRYGGYRQCGVTCKPEGAIHVAGGVLKIFSSNVEKNLNGLNLTDGGYIEMADSLVAENIKEGILANSSLNTTNLKISKSTLSKNGGVSSAKASGVSLNITIQDSEISNNLGPYGGLFVEANDLLDLTITKTKFINNSIDARLRLCVSGNGVLNFVNYGNTTSGSGGNGFQVCNKTFSSNQTWNPGVPFVVSFITVPDNVTLTVNPETIIKFDGFGVGPRSAYIDVRGNGKLDVTGTLEDKVYLTSFRDDSIGGDTNGDSTSTFPAPKDYAGLNVFDSGVINLSNAIVRYGGACQGQFTCNISTAIYSAGPNSKIDILSSEITKNNSGVEIKAGSANIFMSLIHSNSSFGVSIGSQSTTASASATENWWGDSSGPNHSSNSNGGGDRIIGNVKFTPWLTSKPLTNFSIRKPQPIMN